MNATVPARPSESGERITRALGRFFSRWGVDPLQYHWLLQASIKMDFRSTNPLTRQSSGTKSALRSTVLLNLLFSGVMSLMFAHMANTFFYTVIMIGYAMAMMAMMVLMEFGLAVISPDDHLVLAHKPVSSRTFLAVRFSNLMFYVLILDGSLSVIPAMMGLACKQTSWLFPGVYLLVAVLAGFFVAGAVVAFYGFLMRWFNYERFKDVLVYCQVLLSFLFFFGYQLVPRLAGRLHNVDIVHLTHGWAVLFPSVWFAGLLELGLGHWSREALITGAGGLLLMVVALPGLLKAISLDYSENIGRMITASAKSREAKRGRRSGSSPGGRFARLLIPNVEERAFFSFIVTMLRRNRHLKLQLYPNFGLMIAMFVLAVMDHKHLSDPFSSAGRPGMAVTFVSMAFVLGAAGLANLLPYSDEYAGGWLFQVAPVVNTAAILKAVRKAILLFLFLPLLVLEGVLFSFFWPPLHAFELGLYGMLIGSIIFQVALFQFRGFPFSRKPEKGAQSRQFTIVLMMFSMFGVLFLIPMLLSRSQSVVAVTFAIMVVLNLILSAWCNRSYANKSLMPE